MEGMEGIYGYPDDAVQEQQEQQEDYEDEMDYPQRGPDGLLYPSPRESESIYNLFHKVLKQKDSSKVGNLDKPELGQVNLTVRDCQNISLLADELGHSRFGDFFKKRGEITLATSASKKGWFTELFVSQKKFTTRESSTAIQPAEKVKGERKDKWRFGPGR